MFLYTALQWRQLKLLEMVFHIGGMFNRDLFGKQLSIWLSNSICPTPDTSSPLILFSQQLSSSQPYCSNKKKKNRRSKLPAAARLPGAGQHTYRVLAALLVWIQLTSSVTYCTFPLFCRSSLSCLRCICMKHIACAEKYFQMESGTRICLIRRLCVGH